MSALDECHDYYTYSKRVWRLLQNDVKEGRKFSFRNRTTGTSVVEKELLGRAQPYITSYLTSFTFQHLLSLFEDYFFGLVRSWLFAHPANLSKKQIELGTILKSPDKNAIIMAVVDTELNALNYKSVSDWFNYLRGLVKLSCPSAEEIEKLTEIKASRNIIVHNNGIANEIYVRKAGKLARCKDGEILEIPEPYHRESWETIKKVVSDLSTSAIEKARD